VLLVSLDVPLSVVVELDDELDAGGFTVTLGAGLPGTGTGTA
jgi:hypothetical protein